MSNIYLAVKLAPDKLLGRIDDKGIVYQSQIGLDKKIGHVDLATGHVYEDRFGPDKPIGHVGLGDGKVYAERGLIDSYVGRVNANGKMYHHKFLAKDDYIGGVDPFVSFAHSAAAMLLVVLPAFENKKQADSNPTESE